MRRIKELVVTVLSHSNLDRRFWKEASSFVVYVLNRTVNAKDPKKTPYERFFDRKPFIGHVRMFGCVAYKLVPKEQRNGPFQKHAQKMLLMGYEGETNPRLYCPNTNKFSICHDVTYNEMYGKYITVAHTDTVDPFAPVPLPSSSSNVKGEQDLGEHETDIFEDSFQHDPEPTTPHPNDLALQDEVFTTPPERTPQPGSSTTARLQLQMGNKTTEVTVPVGKDTVLRIPKGKGKQTTGVKQPNETTLAKLRDRTGIHPPERYLSLAAFAVPNSYRDAMNSPERDQWVEAISEELQSLAENGTLEIVPRGGTTRTLGTRWVFALKPITNSPLPRFKARVVVQGFRQIPGIDFHDVFAHVARLDSIRLILAIAVKQGFHIRSLDVTTAFLQGELKEELYIEIPEGLHQDKNRVCRLRRPLYGIRQGPACWEKRLTEFLKTLHFKQSVHDPSVFILNQNNTITYVVCYVDDMILTSSSSDELANVFNFLNNEFRLKETQLDSFVGMQILRCSDGSLFIHNTRMATELIAELELDQANPCSIPMQPNVELDHIQPEDSAYSLPYRQTVGSLLFMARASRPDFSYAVCRLAQHCKAYDQQHMAALKACVRYGIGTKEFGLLYDSSDKSMCLRGYADADYANDKHDRKSISGFFFCLGDTPINWRVKKQPIIAQSSTEAEIVALSEACKETVYLRAFLAELGFPQKSPTPVYVDNTSAIKIAHNSTLHGQAKHIAVRFLFARELIQNKTITVNYIPSASQRADIFTKPLRCGTFQRIRDLIKVSSFPETKAIVSSHFSSLPDTTSTGGKGRYRRRQDACYP